MASAYVLNIGGDLGLALELIRKVSEPKSKSKPHITIRYVDVLSDNNLVDYDIKEVSKVEILEPGTFGILNDTHQSNKTVFLECEAEELEDLVHKPHFPDSVFHITLYDGDSAYYAEKLFKSVTSIDWSFELCFQEPVPISKIEIKKRRGKNNSTFRLEDIVYSEDLTVLFYKLTGEHLSYLLLQNLNHNERLAYIEIIVNHISKLTKDYTKLEANEVKHNTKPELKKRVSKDNSLMTSDISSWLKPKVSEEIKNDAFFLTPPELASEITQVALSHLESDNVDFGDPSIGTGVFFLSLMKNLGEKTLSSALGIEVDPDRALTTHRKWNKKGLKVIDGDFLHLELSPKRNLIIANPPYIRFQDLKKEYANNLKERASVILEEKVSGFSGLYVYFILLSHNWMEEGAISTWLIPSGFMENNFGKAIRKYLTTNVTLLRLHKFDENDKQFENATVSSTVIVFKNKKPTKQDMVNYSFGGGLLSPSDDSSISVQALSNAIKWNTPFQKCDVKESKLVLNDLFDIKRGIATGANDFFIMDLVKANVLNIPKSFYKFIIPKANSVVTNIIEAADNGAPVILKPKVVFDCSMEESELIEKYPSIKSYLVEAEKVGVKNRTLVQCRKLWYKQEQREASPFLCTYMGRGSRSKNPIRFIWNRSEAIATNSFIMMYPKAFLQKFMNKSISNQRKVFKLLIDIENSSISDGFRTYSGGLKKMEPKSLKSIVINTPPCWLINILD